jgi:hypothetical protein
MSSILKVDTIQDADGNNIINESGNTITIGASGDTTNIIGTLQNDGAAVGGTNTPYFYGELSSAQNVSNGSSTKAQINNIVLDSASGWDSTNYRYTPGVAGTYFISGSVQSRTNGTNEVAWNTVKIYISGTEYEVADYRGANTQSNYVDRHIVNVSLIRTLSATDYVELYGITYSGGTPQFGNELTSLKVYKLVE